MKHNWEKDENGNVNEWAWEANSHNGVFCVDCGKSVCVHCDPNYMELDDCTGLQKSKPMTNADCIRAMSDEELAKFIANPCQCEVTPERDGFRECGNDSCLKYLLDWLQQPAKEDT